METNKTTSTNLTEGWKKQKKFSKLVRCMENTAKKVDQGIKIGAVILGLATVGGIIYNTVTKDKPADPIIYDSEVAARQYIINNQGIEIIPETNLAPKNYRTNNSRNLSGIPYFPGYKASTNSQDTTEHNINSIFLE